MSHVMTIEFEEIKTNRTAYLNRAKTGPVMRSSSAMRC